MYITLLTLVSLLSFAFCGISKQFGPVTCVTAMCLGKGYELGLAWTLAMITFYCATWEEFHTGDMVLPLVNGPNEGLFLTFSTYMISMVLGPDAWHTQVPSFIMTPFLRTWSQYLFGTEIPRVADVPVVLMTFAGIATVLTHLVNVCIHEIKKGKSAIRALIRCWPLCNILLAFWGGYFLTPWLVRDLPRIFILNISTAFVDASVREHNKRFETQRLLLNFLAGHLFCICRVSS